MSSERTSLASRLRTFGAVSLVLWMIVLVLGLAGFVGGDFVAVFAAAGVLGGILWLAAGGGSA